MKRIYFDFSHISRNTKVTGIPRVSYEYFKRFMRISEERGGDYIVHPVYTEGAGHLKNCIHNMPDDLVILYQDYLYNMARMHPASDLPLLRKLVERQTRVPKSLSKPAPPAPSANHIPTPPFKLRLARARRGILAWVASRDPVLRDRIPKNGERTTGGHTVHHTVQLPQVETETLMTVGTTIRHIGQKGDLLFMPAYWHDTSPMSFFTAQQEGVIVVPLVHDLLPITISDKYEKNWARHFHYNVYATCLISDAVVAISDATRKDIDTLMQSHSFPPPTIRVQHHGYDFGDDAVSDLKSERFPEDAPYFLMVGSIEPKKNHVMVIDSFMEFARTNPGCRLKIVGYPGWMHEEITEYIEQVVSWEEPVDYYRNVDDGELAVAYRNAKATIQASSHEGFGLPIIESLRCGCPVIANDIDVFREIAGDKGIYFSVDDPASLIGVLKDTLAAVPDKAGESFSWPTWDEQSENLFKWLTECKSKTITPFKPI